MTRKPGEGAALVKQLRDAILRSLLLALPVGTHHRASDATPLMASIDVQG